MPKIRKISSVASVSYEGRRPPVEDRAHSWKRVRESRDGRCPRGCNAILVNYDKFPICPVCGYEDYSAQV